MSLNCDMFRLSKLTVEKECRFTMGFYGITVVITGNAEINGIELEEGDRIFISEQEGMMFAE